MLDLWNNIRGKDENVSYGSIKSYKIAAEFLSGCSMIEDWGCGTGTFSKYTDIPVLNIDGSDHICIHKKVDLISYRSKTDGILLRHVLEHNIHWERILANAIASFVKKLCIVNFLDWSVDTHSNIVNYDQHINGTVIPYISISYNSFMQIIGEFEYKIIEIEDIARINVEFSRIFHEKIILIER